MKKKILFINGHLNVGGVEKSLVDLLCHINYDSYEVDLLLFEDLGIYANLVPKNVNIIFKDITMSYGEIKKVIFKCLKNKNWLCFCLRVDGILSKLLNRPIFKLFKKMLNQNKRYDYAIAYRHGFCADVLTECICAKKKYIWWHHGEINLKDKKKFEITCSKVNKVIAVSNGIENELKKVFPDLSDKFFVIPNMIDIENILNKSVEFNPYRSIIKKHILVSVSRFAPEKHLENVVFATRKLIENGYNNFVWYLVGDGYCFNLVKKLTNEYKLNDFIKLVGSKENPYPYMKNANIFVHTSYIESFGIVILEAMSLKCQCVVTKSIGSLSIAMDGYNCVLVDQNIDSLVKGIESIFNNKISDIANNGFNTALSYTPTKIIDMLDELFLKS